MTAPGGPMVLVTTDTEAGTTGRHGGEIRTRPPQARVLIVDDQSPDGTAELGEVPTLCGDRRVGESKLTPPMVAESLPLPWRRVRHGRRPRAAPQARPSAGARTVP